jgi:serine/threonine protein phosphatase PrpC
MIISSGVAYTASLGDSRGVLCTRRQVNRLVPFVPHVEDDIIQTLKESRPLRVDESLFEVQLTRDLKPEDPEEYSRILEAGGRVKRLIDDDGNKIGPFRVWESDSNTPGLTMTRSIGDSAAKSIGLVSTPTVTSLKLNFKEDLFIVIASDGIWHCMDNSDVINFVEICRPMTCKEIIRHKDSEVSVANSCIAQILCEEARVRWLQVVEAEDVEIDDISCVVVEVFTHQEPKKNVLKSKSVKVNMSEKEKPVMIMEKNKRTGRTPTVKLTNIRDPKRGSHVSPIDFDFTDQ